MFGSLGDGVGEMLDRGTEQVSSPPEPDPTAHRDDNKLEEENEALGR
jgi:hypothetical protein